MNHDELQRAKRIENLLRWLVRQALYTTHGPAFTEGSQEERQAHVDGIAKGKIK